ncbi:MAG: hypothetical protein N3A62_10585 [Thermodesulfovibrionales bacterium]|nr:hypothetical protein [Thermodesulfovibrionales bacterium]
MTRDYFIESASKIVLPEKRYVEEYAKNKSVLVDEVNKILLNRKDLAKLIGNDNTDMMMNNHLNHAMFIEAILKAFNPQILVETVLWVFRVYKSHGFNDLYWSAQLDAWLEAMKTHLSDETFKAIKPIYEWMIVNLPAMITLSLQQKDT